MSWESDWSENHTPWDAGSSPPILKELVEQHDLPKGRALVPGCGRGYDVFTLASSERLAIGLDLAPTAALRFEEERKRQQVPAEYAKILIDDFFTFQTEQPFDLIWDYTFLCAIDPSLRQTWAKRAHDLLTPSGELLTLIFPVVDKPKNEGPPYALDPAEVEALLAPHFSTTHLAPVHRSHPARAGKEWLGRWKPL